MTYNLLGKRSLHFSYPIALIRRLTILNSTADCARRRARSRPSPAAARGTRWRRWRTDSSNGTDCCCWSPSNRSLSRGPYCPVAGTSDYQAPAARKCSSRRRFRPRTVVSGKNGGCVLSFFVPYFREIKYPYFEERWEILNLKKKKLTLQFPLAAWIKIVYLFRECFSFLH